MVYLPTFTIKIQPNVGIYTIHGWYGKHVFSDAKKNACDFWPCASCGSDLGLESLLDKKNTGALALGAYLIAGGILRGTMRFPRFLHF